MKYFICLISLLISAYACSYSAKLNNIAQLQWQNRVLILWSTTPKRDLEQLLKTYQAEITDRQLIILVMNQEALMVSNYHGQLTVSLAEHIRVKFPKQKDNSSSLAKMVA